MERMMISGRTTVLGRWWTNDTPERYSFQMYDFVNVIRL